MCWTIYSNKGKSDTPFVELITEICKLLIMLIIKKHQNKRNEGRCKSLKFEEYSLAFCKQSFSYMGSLNICIKVIHVWGNKIFE